MELFTENANLKSNLKFIELFTGNTKSNLKIMKVFTNNAKFNQKVYVIV